MTRTLTLLAAATLVITSANAQSAPQQPGYGAPHQQMPQRTNNQPGYGAPGQQGPQAPYAQPGFQPPTTVNYANLSGNWLYTMPSGQQAFQVQVSPQGQFIARGGPTVIQGQFQGMQARAHAVSKSMRGGPPLRNTFIFQFDGGCHIHTTMLDSRTQRPAGQGVMHVNHQAGAPCPH